MKTFDWIFTWIVPPFLFVWLILWLLAKRKYCSTRTLPDSSPSETTKNIVVDKPETKSFYDKSREALDQAGKVRKLILHSDLPEKDRLQIADEILSLINDIMELHNIKLKEEL